MSTMDKASRSGGTEVLKPPPLMHRNRKGDLYLRTAEVEDQISVALSLDRSELLERAANLDHRSVDYIGPECLVFLIRHFAGARDEEMMEALSGGLLNRSARRIRKGLEPLEDPQARQEAKSWVLAQLFGKILDLESDGGDFFQVRFWVGLNRLTHKALHHGYNAERRANATLRLSQLAGEDADEGDDDDASTFRYVSEAALDPSNWPDRTALLMDAERALASMSPKHAEVFRMRHMFDIPIEDKDPDVYTISRHFDKTPRTIQNWLTAAESALHRWRERNNG